MAVFSSFIAFQSDNSGFVSLIGYLGIVYAFIADIIIFSESFNWVELLAAIIIVIVTVGTSIYKIIEAKRQAEEDYFTNSKVLNQSKM